MKVRIYTMTKYFILDPNAFEHLDYKEDYDENDIYNLSMSELVEKYGDDFSEYWVEVGSTSTLEAIWEKVEELVVDYYENRAIVEDLFSFIPMDIETVKHILNSYNYVLKIET